MDSMDLYRDNPTDCLTAVVITPFVYKRVELCLTGHILQDLHSQTATSSSTGEFPRRLQMLTQNGVELKRKAFPLHSSLFSHSVQVTFSSEGGREVGSPWDVLCQYFGSEMSVTGHP